MRLLSAPLLVAILCTIFPACTQPGGSSTTSAGNPRNANNPRNPYRYPPARVGNTKTIRFASTDGRFVGLADGSTWNVDWSKAATSRNWRSGQRVTISGPSSGSFPYRLTDQNGRSVPARVGKKLD